MTHYAILFALTALCCAGTFTVIVELWGFRITERQALQDDQAWAIDNADGYEESLVADGADGERS